ncbi:hypothetical protein Btru_016715 [Bulinus truncatus]|nr:hypothetical protein Btru_016715 [Bulinus truncatus]
MFSRSNGCKPFLVLHSYLLGSGVLMNGLPLGMDYFYLCEWITLTPDAMDINSLTLILSAGISLMFLNNFIVWKLWPVFSNETGVRRRTVQSTILLDPFVSAIACPLAADLRSSFSWLGCEGYFVAVITSVMVILYVSSLVITHRLMVIMSPAPAQGVDGSPWNNPSTLSFYLSVAINILLTWTVLALLPPADVDAMMYDSESCLASVRQKSVVFIFIMCMVIQMVHILFLACLSQSVVSKYSNVLYAHEQGSEKFEDADRKSIVIYTSVAMFCLTAANLLRLCFTHCSCYHFFILANGLYFTNWVVAIKLPSSGLIYIMFNSWIKRIS